MKNVTYKVPGMSCDHCKRAITMSLQELDGINKIDIDIKEKKVNVEYSEDAISENKLKEAIEDAGYDIE